MGHSAEGVETKPGSNAEWLDRSAYPFESRYFNTEAGRIHYVDEGEGRPILFLHGVPSWSFLYRDVIAELSDSYRCVAPDMLGFGLSEKLRDWSYRPEDHAAVLSSFIETLGLEELTLVVQDWSGAIGLSYALDQPDNIHSLVILNTSMWPAEEISQRLLATVFGSRLGRYLVADLGLESELVVDFEITLAALLATAYLAYP